MKILVIFTFLIVAKLAIAQDCTFCLPDLSFLWPVRTSEWPIEYTKIEKVEYERNPKATFCKRPVDIVDTIVLHHSETPNTDGPQKINDYHLARGTKEDPWYMIAYSYTINSPYSGSTMPRTRVTEGRPLDLVGAHAGSNVFVPMDKEQKKLWDDGKIICGKEDSEFKVDPTLVKDGKIKANVTTVGLVVIGNYAQFSDSNPNGFSRRNPRYPTKSTQDLIARMSCQLQKKYPKIKKIRWHSFYHPTSCPGTILQYIDQIKTLARNYGCDFNY